MTKFNLELTGRYVSAGPDRAPVRTIYDADKRVGMTPPTSAALPSSRTAERHLEHVGHDVSQRSVVVPPTRRGDTA